MVCPRTNSGYLCLSSTRLWLTFLTSLFSFAFELLFIGEPGSTPSSLSNSVEPWQYTCSYGARYRNHHQICEHQAGTISGTRTAITESTPPTSLQEDPTTTCGRPVRLSECSSLRVATTNQPACACRCNILVDVLHSILQLWRLFMNSTTHWQHLATKCPDL